MPSVYKLEKKKECDCFVAVFTIQLIGRFGNMSGYLLDMGEWRKRQLLELAIYRQKQEREREGALQ